MTHDNNHASALTIEIHSFSYKEPLPPTLFSWDEGRHGGGFVFDCRCLPNPGREERFKSQTGLDTGVKEYLLALDEVADFKNRSFSLIVAAVEQYLSRRFTFLSVGFGCTGGQHRSVFMADKLGSELIERFGDKVTVIVQHVNLKAKGFI
jgi:RNase adaptor protein for sRNA GlmZ degradation